MQKLETDVLVIGGGGAAARAAIEAHRAGARVTLVTKGSFGAIGTRGCGATAGGFSAAGVFATPGWTGQLTPAEKMVTHMIAAPLETAYQNIIQVGLGMADPKLARVLVEDAVATRLTLFEMGATFGEAGLRSHGVPIMAALVSQIKRSGINIIDRTMITSLLIQSGECLGAMGIHELKGEPILITAGATVIGTGGDANLFMLNLNPSCNTGDGYALGYEAGAELMNLEFKQIFLGTIFPTRNMLTQFITPYVKFLNAAGEEFLHRYLPPGATVEECLAQRRLHNPFSTRDQYSRYFDIGIINEVRAGRGTVHSGVYLDRTDPRIPKLNPPASEFWEYRAIDFSNPVEVGICHHCSLGGYRIDENASTTIPGLYAAGEAAAGPHGADRMGGHMLLASQVFGARAGKNGATLARAKKVNVDLKTIQKAEEQISAIPRNGDISPAEVKKMLQQAAYFDLLTIRSRNSLTRFLVEVKKLKNDLFPRLKVNTPLELVDALELQNLLTLGEIEAEVCLHRTESRGPHYREDYPKQDDKNWLKVITVKKLNDKPALDTIALDPSWQSKGDEKLGYWG